MRRFTTVAALILSLLAVPSALLADSTFNFTDLSSLTPTPFSDTQKGITATFSSPSDPAGFVVADPSVFDFQTITGNVLLTNIPGSTLNIGFASPLDTFSLLFGLAGGPADTLTLTAYLNGSQVGSPVVAGGTIPAGGIFPEGSLAFSGDYNSVSISSSTDYFAVGDVTATPEPTSVVLLATGMLGLASAGYRRRRNRQ
jgi:hypothetical protein